MTFRRLAPTLLLATLVVLALVTHAGTSEPRLVPTEVSDLAELDGSARIIVRLNVPFAPEGLLVTSAHVLAQRQTISMVRSSVTAGVRGTGHSVVRTFDELPLMAMDATPATLRMLESMRGLVAEVVEDRPIPPVLAVSVPLIGGAAAWQGGVDGTGTVVAILDTGVDKTHPFFAGKVIAEACFSSNVPAQSATSACPGGATSSTAPGSGMPCTASGCYHGTHVAGIAAGGTTGVSGAGVAPGAKIVAVQVFSNFPDGPGSYSSDQIAALNYIYNNRNNPAVTGGRRIAAANMSLGGDAFLGYCDTQPQKVAIDLLRSVGIATVVASGNDFFVNAISTPACISSAVSVGSTTKADVVSSFSNVAPFMNLFAPGSGITSAMPGNAFGTLSGTSMAAPHVAGAFAIMRQVAPALTVDQIVAELENTGKPITDARPVPGFNGHATRPRVNVLAALQQVTTADLMVQTLTAAPLKALPSTAVNVTVAARNAGLAATPGSLVRLYLSTSSTINTGLTVLGQVPVAPLAALKTSTAAVVPVTIPSGTPPGAYFIWAIVEPAAGVTETSADNNTKATPIEVIAPDLLVTALSSGTVAQTTRPLAVSSTVRNGGAAPARPFRVSFYMAPGDSTPGAGTQVGFRDVVGLAARTNSSAVTTLTVPGNLSAGVYFLSARVDSGNGVGESDETNNGLTAAQPVTVTEYKPDFIVTALSSPPAGATNRPLTLGSTVRNQGAAPAKAFRINFYMSPDSSVPGAGRLVGFRLVTALAGFTNSSAPTTVTLPGNLSEGSHFLSAVVDPLTNVELSGANNGFLAPGPVNVSLYQPELSLTALSGPALGKIGRTIAVTSAVRNVGPAPASKPFKVRFYLASGDSTPGAGTPIGVRDVPSLAVGANVSAVTLLTIPATAGLGEGPHFLSAIADADGVHPERNEADNRRTAANPVELTLLRPDFTVTAATVTPALASPGFPIKVSSTIQNAGDVPTAAPVLVRFYLSPTPGLTGAEVLLGERTIAAPLAAKALSTAITALTVPPGTPPGAYFIVVRANANGAVVEYPGANNIKATTALNVKRPNIQIVSIAPPLAAIRGKLDAPPAAAVVLRNIGAGPAVPFDLQVFATRDDGSPAAPAPGSGDVIATKTVATLAPNGTVTVLAPVIVQDAVNDIVRLAGKYYISAVADAAGRNDDDDTGNNRLTELVKKVAILPDVRKLKTASVIVTLGACDLAGTQLNLSGPFKATSQTVANPSVFTATMPLVDPSLGFSQTYTVTGRVEAIDVEGTAGKVRSTFTYTSAGPDGPSSGRGDINGAAPARALAGAITGADTSAGDTCTFSGTVSIDPLP